MRATSHLLGLAGVAVLVAGCGTGTDAESLNAANSTSEENTVTEGDADPAEESGDEPVTKAVSGEFAICDGREEDLTGATYSETVVPVGAEFDVTVTETPNGGTRVELSVTGVAPSRDFGAHLHTDPCGPDPADSGPHYQNEVDPAATPDEPSTDPEFANPENELWLDFTTDAAGNGEAEATVDWQVRPGEANAIVLHEQHTATEPGEAGAAGDRFACINVAL
ncbi:superoxide dismutase family protein [Allosalinactinospora lopnorensis]|uniref:superoxide dismutase family protein n=1 Tax=Allosalinactinospora lopnorensis TaxID=1352348 RepID=UPI000623D1A3|nr:superoxide dismutase family protein [Allosalinactinospora lopnorensis]